MRKPLIPSLLVAVAVVLAGLTVVFDWGWVVWMSALGLGAIGLFFLALALADGRRMPVVGAIAAVAVVAVVVGGVAAVRLQPVLPTGFAIEDREKLVGRAGDTIIVAGRPGQDDTSSSSSNDKAFGVRGLRISGAEFWSHPAGEIEDPTPKVSIVDDIVLLVWTREDDVATATGLDVATGDEVWTRDLPAGSKLLTVTAETAVFSSPGQGATALFVATGIPRWSNPDGAISTYRSAGYRHLQPRVIAPVNEAWGLLEGDDPAAPDAASINLDSGEPGPRMALGDADYTMVGGILVTEEFGFGANAPTTLRGASVDGRVSWSKQIVVENAIGMAAIDGEVVVQTSGGTSVIVATNGESTEHLLPDGWTRDTKLLAGYERQLDARYELTVEGDGSTGAFDRVSGEHVELSGRGSLVAGNRSLGDSETTVLVSRVSDAVGGDAYRYDVVAEGALRQTIYADSDEVEWRPGALQLTNRVVPLD